MESDRPVQLMTPLSARTYLEAYYDINDPKISQIMVPLVDEFKAWDIIPVETLEDTWPEGMWESPESDEATADEAVVPELEKMKISSPDTFKSLREGAMATTLQALLDRSDDDNSILSEAELLTDFLPKLKETLYKQSSSLKSSPHVLDLLCKALQGELDVDLSPFTSLSVGDMAFVVSKLQKHGKMRTLCISNRPDLTAEDLQVVLRDAAGLKALYLLEDPQIPAQVIGSLVKDCDIYSSDLFRQAIKPDPRRFSRDSSPSITNDPLPISQPGKCNDMSQLVWIGVSAQQALDKRHRLESGLIDWENLRQEKRPRDFGWSEGGLRYTKHPFDTPLSTSRTVAGLMCLFQWSCSSALYGAVSFLKGTALSFALATPLNQGENNFGIGPEDGGHGLGIGHLATGLYGDGREEPDSTDEAPEHLEPGRWVVVLIHEACNARSQKYLDNCQRGKPAYTDSDDEDDNSPGQSKGPGPHDPLENKAKQNQGLPFRAIKRLRYALVTPCTEPQPSGRDYIVADIPTYLEYIMGKDDDDDKGTAAGDLKKQKKKKLVEAYNGGMATMETVDFYKDEDIHDILPKVFPKQKAASSTSKAQ